MSAPRRFADLHKRSYGPTRSDLRREGFTPSVVATRRWMCLRCPKRWRSHTKIACPYCYGPTQEVA